VRLISCQRARCFEEQDVLSGHVRICEGWGLGPVYSTISSLTPCGDLVCFSPILIEESGSFHEKNDYRDRNRPIDRRAVFSDGQQHLDLDNAARTQLPGEFIRLSDGVTHYELAGPDDGPPVVLIHGYSVPYFLWDHVFPVLADEGFRVLRYDLYGRDFSDRPRADYNPALFDRQLVELLDALEMSESVALVGISMGGAVAVVFTADHPDRVTKAALISPFGFPQDLGLGPRLMKIPGIGEYLINVIGDRVFKGRLPSNFYEPLDLERIRGQFAEQMEYRGYKRALLGSMRSFMPLDFTPRFEAVGRLGKPTLLIWGKLDAVVPFAFSELALKAIPQAEFHPLEGRGHVPTLEDPELINGILLEFLRE
jgi:pimeloyl-ACP methyl ester carboxylesterase